jgi:hypothetical protein
MTKKTVSNWEKQYEERKAEWARERLARIESMGDTPERYIYEYLGICGQMISGSKSGYRDALPCNVPIFNSNVIAARGNDLEKIWYGDIDLTLSEGNLAKLATKLNATIYVLREMDGRFENEDKPKIDRYVFMVRPGWVDGEIGGDLENYVTRAKRGKLASRLVYKKEFR